jgi:hypothetical protein
MLPLLELTHDLVGDLDRLTSDIDDDRVFVRRGLFQCRELAVEQGNRHEVFVPRRHALVDQIARSLEVGQHYVMTVADDDVPVGSLQRRAGQDATFAPRPPPIDFLGDLAEPGQTVRVGQWRPVAHLLDILARVQIVAFLKLAAQRGCEQGCDRGLPDPETPISTTITVRATG